MVDTDGKPLTDQHLRDVVLNFIIAGRDTTSNALSWAINFIAEDPAVEEKLRAELEGIGSDPDYQQMTYRQLFFYAWPDYFSEYGCGSTACGCITSVWLLSY